MSEIGIMERDCGKVQLGLRASQNKKESKAKTTSIGSVVQGCGATFLQMEIPCQEPLYPYGITDSGSVLSDTWYPTSIQDSLTLPQSSSEGSNNIEM